MEEIIVSRKEKIFWALFGTGLLVGGIWVLKKAGEPEEKPTPPIVRLPKARLEE